MARGETAIPGLAKDHGKQLVAEPAIPKLTAEATRHPRVPKGLAGAHHPPSSFWAGRKELCGVLIPPATTRCV